MGIYILKSYSCQGQALLIFLNVLGWAEKSGLKAQRTYVMNILVFLLIFYETSTLGFTFLSPEAGQRT